MAHMTDFLPEVEEKMTIFSGICGLPYIMCHPEAWGDVLPTQWLDS